MRDKHQERLETVIGPSVAPAALRHPHSRVNSHKMKEPLAESKRTNPPPRVLHIMLELRPSGAEVMLRIAAPLWFARVNTHSILATGQSEGSYANVLRASGFNVHHIPFSKTLSFFYQVFTFLRSGKFDAVHIHTEQANVYYGLIARLAGIRTIVHTIHNVFPFEGSLRLVRIAMRKGLRSIGATAVAVGQSVAENEQKRFHNPALVIPNWYDASLFRPPSSEERAQARRFYGVLDNRPVVVTMGNCNEWKNHAVLFQALRILADKRGDWFYLHAGAEDQSRSEYHLAGELGLRDRCAFLGLITDPRTALWAADVFAMPSIREGFSIAAIEAAACGLPLVLSDVPGLRDLKATMSDAFWVAPEPELLASAIETAYQHFPLGSLHNASSARSEFGGETGARAYYTLYAAAQCAR
ncbi:MAG: glycosyltransferase [Bryobacterales bacterium]|nr:glycosyltransferase [Bryobacterales bacterium]